LQIEHEAEKRNITKTHRRPTSYSGANMRTTPIDCDTKCLLWKCRLPSNRVTASQSKHCRIANISNWCTFSPQGPCDV